jgi:leader peptidase (prepilin peptidase)/N-methyltransferase
VSLASIRGDAHSDGIPAPNVQTPNERLRRNVYRSVTERVTPRLEEIEPEPEARDLRRLLPSGTEAAVVAMVGTALAAASLIWFGLGGRGLVGVVLCPALVLLTAVDLRHRLLPNLIVLPAAGVVAVIVAVSNPGDFVGHAVAGAIFAGVLLVAVLVFPPGLGMGDVKLALLIGVALGARTGAAALVTALASFAVAVVMLVLEGRAALRRSIAFGPLLAAGGLVAYFFG